MLTLHPDSIKVGKRFRKDLGNIDALVDSIREVGLLHRVVVDAHGNLIAGERRLAACVRLGLRDIPATIVELDAEKTLRAQDDENSIRKDFTPTEAVAIRDARLQREKEKAKERQSDLNRPAASGNFPQADKGKAKDKAAEGTGYCGKTLDKAATVMEAAAADPELEHVVDEMDKTGKVDPAYQKLRRPKPKPPTPAEIAGRNSARSKRCDEEISHLMHKYRDLKRWQPVWDAYRKVVNADRVIDIVPAVTGAESTTTPRRAAKAAS